MKLNEYTADFQTLVSYASRLLGGEARPLQLEWLVEQTFERRLIRRRQIGLGSGHPVLWLHDSRRGHDVSVGVQCYSLNVGDSDIEIAQVVPPRTTGLPMFWAVLKSDMRRFYRFIRERLKENRAENVEPILHGTTRSRLWDNTIGFLRRDVLELKRFGVPQKRGVLLSGSPGNGKTMACRWLRAQCYRYGLEWEDVTMDDYEAARRDGRLHDLFQPDDPGIVLFDDFDIALRDRRSCDNPREQSTFLAEMDGMCPKSGVVYLFTSNLETHELDDALRRPGRIDQVISFVKPDADLRERVIRERWHPELIAQFDVQEVVGKTNGFSFADLEELKKQLVLHHLDGRSIDCQGVLNQLKDTADVSRKRREIGFAVRPSVADTSSATVACG